MMTNAQQFDMKPLPGELTITINKGVMLEAKILYCVKNHSSIIHSVFSNLLHY
jgi:hypothetical protein